MHKYTAVATQTADKKPELRKNIHALAIAKDTILHFGLGLLGVYRGV